MGGIEIFIGGGILLCNAVLVAYLITSSRNRNNPSGKIAPPDSAQRPEEPDTQSLNGEVPDNGVAPSKFNMDEFMAKIASEIVSDVRKELPKLLSEMVGDLKESDVEFVPESEINNFTPAKVIAPLNSEEIDEVFSTDMRDIDDTPPSEPMAKASSIDELEQAVETAVNPESSDEELAAAGKVIEPYKVTKFYDVITSNEEIDRRVELCFRLSLKSEMSLKEVKPKKAVSKPKIATDVVKKAPSRSLSINLDNVDPDTFDVADILKK